MRHRRLLTRCIIRASYVLVIPFVIIRQIMTVLQRAASVLCRKKKEKFIEYFNLVNLKLNFS